MTRGSAAPLSGRLGDRVRNDCRGLFGPHAVTRVVELVLLGEGHLVGKSARRAREVESLSRARNDLSVRQGELEVNLVRNRPRNGEVLPVRGITELDPSRSGVPRLAWIVVVDRVDVGP